MATRLITGLIRHPDNDPWAGGKVVFRLVDDTFRLAPAETYPIDEIVAVANASGAISVTLVSGPDIVYEVTLPDREKFRIAVPDGAATTLETLRGDFNGIPIGVGTMVGPQGPPGADGDLTQAAADTRYVNVAGDTMTGNLGLSGAGASPYLLLIDTSAPTNEKVWGLAQANGVLLLQALTDAFGSAVNAMVIDRTGTTPSPPEFSGLAGTGTRKVSASSTGLLSANPAPSIVIPFLNPVSTPVAWNNMPAAEAYFNANANWQYALDTRYHTEARLVVVTTVVGSAGSKLMFRSTPDGVAFTSLAECAITSLGLNMGSWTTIAAASKFATVQCFLRGSGGDGAADPAFSQIYVEIR